MRGSLYTRPVPFGNLHGLVAEGGGWMVPYAWVSLQFRTLESRWSRRQSGRSRTLDRGGPDR
jgi:hypothetical protein